MPMPQDMHSLAQEVVRSHQARAATVAQLRDDVASQKQATAAHLRDLDRAGGDAAAKQHGSLQKARANIAGAVAQKRSNAAASLKGLAASRQAKAHEQLAALVRGQADLAQAVGQKRAEVAAWLKDTAAAHRTTARQQRARLAGNKAQMARTESQRRSRVRGWLKSISADRDCARREWQAMDVKLRGPLAGGGGSSDEPSAGLPGLRDHVLKFISAHSAGTRLRELEQRFGLSRIQMAMLVKALVNSGRVRKQDLLYFAVDET
ncbi:MAG: hypothetical protein HY671_13360 [Chloroflexi bacterium]|nr:hypothetical protein [Chloroflexota bacterium]